MTAVRRLAGAVRSHPWRAALAAAVVVAAAVLATRALTMRNPIPTALAVEGRRLHGLERFLAAHPDGFPDGNRDRLLIRLDQDVLRGAVAGVLPYEAAFGDALTLRFDEVDLAMDGGIPLVRLRGRGSLTARDVSADITVVLTLDVRTGDGRLVTRADVLGFELTHLRVQEAPVELLDALNRLAEDIFLAIGRRVSGAEIPVRLPDAVEIPAVNEPEITIPAARVPMAVDVHDVLPFGGSLWVSLSVTPGVESAADVDVEAGATGGPDEGEGAPAAAASRAPGRDAAPDDPCATGRRIGLDWCGSPSTVDTVAMAARIAAWEDSVAVLTRDVFAAGEAGEADEADGSDVRIRLAMTLVRDILTEASNRYLDSLSLHVRSPIDIREEGEVSGRLGPFRVTVGSWALHLTIEELNATLRGGTLSIEPLASDRLGIRIPVDVTDVTGRARVRFAWDADAVAGLLCGDFTLDEVFQGTVPPETRELVGYFRFSVDSVGLVAVPVQTAPLTVRPVAEDAAWQRVRQVLDARDGALQCGLGMDPEDMERRLRERMDRGFDFELPGSVLQSVVLPAFVFTDTAFGEARYRLQSRPQSLVLSDDAVEYGFTLVVETSGG